MEQEVKITLKDLMAWGKTIVLSTLEEVDLISDTMTRAQIIKKYGRHFYSKGLKVWNIEKNGGKTASVKIPRSQVLAYWHECNLNESFVTKKRKR